MGRIDAITNEYMSDSSRFADVFNFFLYDGKQTIVPDKLKDMDRAAIAFPFGADAKKSDVIQKYRDVYKVLAAKEDANSAYLLLGVEDQAYVHYAMPVRNMLYDAAGYAMQVENLTKSHRQKRDVHRDEYLSGFKKSDKLIPIITLVIYWSPKEWDGPRCLHEMFSVQDAYVLKHVPDYRINLVSPRDIFDNDFRKFHTTLAAALQFIKHSGNKIELEALMDADRDYEHLDRRTVELLNEVAGAGITIPEGAKEVNVCKAIEDMKKEAAENAAKEAIIAARAEAKEAMIAVKAEAKEAENRAVENTLIESIKSLMETMKLTAEQAMDALKIKAEDRSRYMGML